MRDRKPSGPPGFSYQLPKIDAKDSTLTESSVTTGLCSSEREILAKRRKSGVNTMRCMSAVAQHTLTGDHVSKKTLAMYRYRNIHKIRQSH